MHGRNLLLVSKNAQKVKAEEILWTRYYENYYIYWHIYLIPLWQYKLRCEIF